MNAIEYIREQGHVRPSSDQDANWGTEADWECLMDDIIGGMSEDEIGTGGVEKWHYRVANEALDQSERDMATD